MKAAVIGAGFVGRAHIEALRRLGIEIGGLLGSSPERTQQQCSGLGIARGYSSMEELAGDASVGAVHVCTPNHLHFAEARAALEANKHVLCEKPLATSAEDARRMVAQAREMRRVLFPCHNYKHAPVIKAVRQILDAGLLGKVQLVTLQTTWVR